MTISGRNYPVRLLAKRYSGPVDLALFFLDGLEMHPVYQIADESPGFNEPAWIVGFPRHRLGGFRETRGKIEPSAVVGYEYQFNRMALNGESGGPLFVANFRVAGIVSASARGETLCSTVPEIRNFVTSAIGSIPNCSKPKEPTVAPPPPKEPNVDPSPGIAALLKRIEELENKVNELSKQKGPQGDIGIPGPQGQQGRDGQAGQAGVTGPAGSKGASGRDGKLGTITVILIDSNGKELSKAEGLKAGNVVRLKIDRFLKEK